MVESFVDISDVSKIIKKQTILDRIRLQVHSGEVVALCGANGAGKSTLIRMLVGILQPTQGTIRINGLEWRKHRREYAAQIGYMPDDYHFGNGLSAAETLYFWAALRGLPRARADEALAEVGLSEHGGKPVSAFSKGMRQRVLFAQALLANPPLIILDEPTNGLDPYWMDAFVQLVKRLKHAGRTVIFSTHQINIAEAVADRAVFMHQGRIVRNEPQEKIEERQESGGLHGVFSELLGIRS